ncbi:MAG: hypothetical protein M1833_006634 [Piccolia ochrophora]|nr:MAG: hypothetical protein M1833_006634 [Piccolia ochrophora]
MDTSSSSALSAPSAPIIPSSRSSRLTILISGNGTNLQALIDAAADSTLPHTTIVRVISNRKAAYGLQRATAASIPTHYHPLPPYKSQHPSTPAGVLEARHAYDRDLAAVVLADAPDLVVCAGWMHVLSPAFLDVVAAAKVPVINLHPALPGQFDGANAIQRAYEAFRKGEVSKTGVMVHRVVTEVDRGEPVVVKEVEMREGDVEEEVERRVRDAERPLLVEGTRVVLARLRGEQPSHG